MKVEDLAVGVTLRFAGQVRVCVRVRFDARYGQRRGEERGERGERRREEVDVCSKRTWDVSEARESEG